MLECDLNLIRASENLLHAAEAAGQIASTHHYWGTIARYKKSAEGNDMESFKNAEILLNLWVLKGSERFMPNKYRNAVNQLIDDLQNPNI